MASRHEYVLENGNRFYIRRYDPFISLRILGEVQKRFLGPLSAIMEAKDSKEDDTAFQAAIEKISKSLDGDILVDLTKKVLDPNFVSVVIDNGQPARLDEGQLNQAVDGIYDVVALVFEVLRYNYSDLFTRGRTLIGQVQSNTAIH
jgi:hypothetical protein